ncbi:lasso peptide biosynthesis PqqD family chaperone [Bacillus sp. 123MFChir2]|uniref:lasso peptide biosynthesis PqqD family chaperone n=1 Tax=Bacillus sp. 123MFChir2 TaxID=1169144 RepID=UPI00036F54B4|nr:lasso peptide biosynthesis PqqD family chaperone [Bacillus sp. 123MFChir2]
MISLDFQIVQNKGNIVSDMDGEKVMLNVRKGKYYNLGGMGGEIWDCIEKPITVSQLVTILLSNYDVEETDCEKQVLSFLECLLQENLIHIENQSNT